ncbi:class I SAM-dependent methyltransferase [Patescibacteria group bacterium]|nr:class I SAM-dependent methyltransferase [Patescibacteria group bacterium]
MATSLTDFYLSYSNELYKNPIFSKEILSHQEFLNTSNSLSGKETFEKILQHYLEEAELTLSLIQTLHYSKKDFMLEIGGGLGLVYGFLRKQGYTIYAIEPSDSGFGGYFNAARELFKIIDVDKSHFYPLLSEDCTKINERFDVLFSNNVLEHIPEFDKSFLAMKNVLKPGGVMIHNTANYFVPYEPHINIMLVPLFPKLTPFFAPRLKKSSLWNGLYFVTTRKLKKLCKSMDLTITFKRDSLQKTLHRLDTDPGFAERQKYFVALYSLLKRTRLVRILDNVPVALTTPITFTVEKRFTDTI